MCLYLIDGSAMIYRAYFAVPPMVKRDGSPVNAVYGFADMLWRLIQNHRQRMTHLAVIFDKSRRCFRHDLYPPYKANRSPTPEALAPQFKEIRAVVRAFGVPCLEQDGFEADDLIASYTKAAGDLAVTIVSSDKDLMQLISSRVTMFDAMQNRTIGPNEVQQKYGVKPEQLTDVFALMGDTVDNVPGVPWVGIKTAADLISSFGTLEGVLASTHLVKKPKIRDSLKEHADTARLSKQLVTLDDAVPLDVPFSDLTLQEPDRPAVCDFLRSIELSNIARSIEASP